MTLCRDNRRQVNGRLSTRLHAFSDSYRTGRVMVYFLTVSLKLVALFVSVLAIHVGIVAMSLGGSFLWLSWLGALFVVAAPGTDRFLRDRLHRLKPVAVAATLAILAVGVLWGATVTALDLGYTRVFHGTAPWVTDPLVELFKYNDVTALCHQAADNLLEGKNPYAAVNIVTASIDYGVPGIQITPLRRGAFADAFPYPDYHQLDAFWAEAQKHPDVVPVEVASQYAYPAGSFLVLAPFLLMGVWDIRIVFALLIVASLGITFWLARNDRRTILILAILSSLGMLTSTAMGDTGVMQLPFLLLGWVLWKSHWKTSALLMGVAVSIKQVSWLYFLFYLVLVLREIGPRRLFATLGVAGGVFVALNLPFVIADPALWFSSIMAVLTDPQFPVGLGLISIVFNGVVVIKESLVFNGLALAALAAGVVWYYRNCRRVPYAGPILAIAPFFFAWRSLWGYFFMADLIMLACILVNEYSGSQYERLEKQVSPLAG